mgnify:CR=1 FL=1
MQVEVKLSLGSNYEIKEEINRLINNQVKTIVDARIKEIDVDRLIELAIRDEINRSKYVTDNVIRNLVQQRIAKEITIKIMDSSDPESINPGK